MKKHLPIVSLIIVSVIAQSLFAQKKDVTTAVNARASRLIDSTMSALNLRAERFNQELQIINQTNPLAATSLTPEKIPANITKVKDFIAYLDVYRSMSVRHRKEIEDSVKAMRMDLPVKMREDFLAEFLDAYKKDQDAFDRYTIALTRVYASVSEVLNFFSTAKTSLVDGKIQFESKEDFDRYEAMMDIVNKSNKKLITASADSQKATLEAGEVMNKTYGSGAK